MPIGILRFFGSKRPLNFTKTDAWDREAFHAVEELGGWTSPNAGTMICHDFSIVHEIPYVGLPEGGDWRYPPCDPVLDGRRLGHAGCICHFARGVQHAHGDRLQLFRQRHRLCVSHGHGQRDSWDADEEAWLNVKPTSLKQKTMFMNTRRSSLMLD